MVEFEGFLIWDLMFMFVIDEWNILFFVKNVVNIDGVMGVFIEVEFGLVFVWDFYGLNSC